MLTHFKNCMICISLLALAPIAYADGVGGTSRDLDDASISEPVEREGRSATAEAALVSKRDRNGRPSTVRTPSGKDVRLEYDGKGRVNSLDFGREGSIFVTFVDGSDRIATISISSELAAKTVTLDKPTRKVKRVAAGAKIDSMPEDDYFNQLMIESMIDEILNPWGSGLEWDLLNTWERTPEERNKCMDDCTRRCNRGAAVATAVCVIGSLLTGPLAPAVAATCTVQVAFGAIMCAEACPNRCE